MALVIFLLVLAEGVKQLIGYVAAVYATDLIKTSLAVPLSMLKILACFRGLLHIIETDTETLGLLVECLKE